LYDLIRVGLLVRTGWTAPRNIRWSQIGLDNEFASGRISAGMERDTGWLQIEVAGLNQCLTLQRLPRHYGGGQWYFVCPVTSCLCSAVWMPPGGAMFAARKAWQGVAYRSQLQRPFERALAQGHAMRRRLGGLALAGYGREDPPKPRWMRRRTYERMLELSRRYERLAYRAAGFPT